MEAADREKSYNVLTEFKSLQHYWKTFKAFLPSCAKVVGRDTVEKNSKKEYMKIDGL